MSASPILTVENLGKRFKIYPSPWSRGVEWGTLGRARRHTDFWALRNVYFRVLEGECFGIIGPNGSGKTTILKILSRVLAPSEGSFHFGGKTIYSLLELGTGFHPDLTGRENVHESARLLCLPDSTLTKDRLAEIERFADIGEYFDRPVRFYSSGMRVRLGFSMFAFLQPDVFIVDEALSVGDIFFQQKCAQRIEAMRQSGTTFIFVSHDMIAVRRLCRTAMVLSTGRPFFTGSSEEAINRYNALVFGRDPSRPAPYLQDRDSNPEAGMTAERVLGGNVLAKSRQRHGTRALELVAARVTDPTGQDTLTVRSREALRFDLLVVAHEPVASPSAGIHLYDRFGNLVFAAGTAHHRHRLPALQKGERVVVRLTIQLNVQPGQYTFTLGTSELGHIHDWHENLGPIEIFHDSPDPLPFAGLAELPMTCRHGAVEPLPPAGNPEESLSRR